MKILAAIQNFPVHWTYCFSSKGQQKFGANLIALGKVTVRIVDAGTMLTVAATLYPI